MMKQKRKILLLNAQQLLGESIEHTLRQEENLEVDGPWQIDDQVIDRLSLCKPDLILITDENMSNEEISHLTAQIIDRFPDLPVFRVTLERNQMQVYSSHIIPARKADLIELILQLPFAADHATSEEKSAR